jgi:hypothetical protein
VLAVFPSAASAMKNPYTAKGLCGPGYKIIDRHKLYDDTNPSGKRLHLADTVLLWKNGVNCAVTIKKRRINKPDYLWVSLQSHTAGDGDGRQGLKFFAGPSYVNAPGQCIQWWGGAELKYPPGGRWYKLYDAFRTGWEHCG